MSVNPPKLLIVGGNARNQKLLADFIKKLGYETIRADTLEILDSILDGAPEAGFALVDISGFDETVWNRCARLHKMDIPLLLISPKQSAAVRKLGFAHGAQTVLEKPLVMRELADTIHGFMRAQE